ncbi:MAG: glycoside hydrolase, partial [Oscillospiraceae bacterium]|nr:glycoside hydrolase [Oscillospiraceae bacterium]
MTQGIDVSTFQGTIDWRNVKANGIDFSIIRAGYGRDISQKDEKFEQNYQGCRTNNINTGAYWYSYATSPEDTRLEASACLN